MKTHKIYMWNISHQS